jgi:hypothetical protein
VAGTALESALVKAEHCAQLNATAIQAWKESLAVKLSDDAWISEVERKMAIHRILPISVFRPAFSGLRDAK